MKAKDIEKILNNGGKLILKSNTYFFDWYYVGKEEAKNRINKKQFEKYKSKCKNKDENEKSNVEFNDKSYCLYYWL